MIRPNTFSLNSRYMGGMRALPNRDSQVKEHPISIAASLRAILGFQGGWYGVAIPYQLRHLNAQFLVVLKPLPGDGKESEEHRDREEEKGVRDQRANNSNEKRNILSPYSRDTRTRFVESRVLMGLHKRR